MKNNKILVFFLFCFIIFSFSIIKIKEVTAISIDNVNSSTSSISRDSNLIYCETFDGLNTLPTGWYLPSGNNGSVKVSNNSLRIETMENINPSAVYFDTTKANYIVEAEFKVESILNSARWFGICFRVQETDGWAKASVGFNGVQALNYYNKTAISGGGYVEDVKGTNPVSVELNKTYTLKVICYESSVAAYINGIFFNQTTLSNPYSSSGDVGVCVSGMDVNIDNFKIYEATEPGKTSGYEPVQVYIPQTGIVNPPVAVSKSINNTPTAAVAMLTVDTNGNVKDYNGVNVGTLNDSNSILGNSTIPAFKVDSLDAANLVSQYVVDKCLLDSYVVVDEEHIDLLREVTDVAPLMKGIVEIETSPKTKEQARNILLKVNSASANVVLFKELLSREMAFYFQCRMLTVWSEVSSIEEIYCAITAGVNGIVSENSKEIYEVYESFKETTVIRQPMVVAHRGASSLYPQNSLKSYQLAYELGANAIEIDIRLSSDKEVVLFHDDNLDYLTTGSGPITSKTLEYLKNNVKIDIFPGVLETIPTLEETFAYFKGKDIVFLLDMKIYTQDTTALDKTRDLIRKYNMEDQCIVMMDNNANLLAESEKKLPDVSRAYGGLSSLLQNLDHDSSLITSVIAMTPSASQPFPYWYNTDGDWSYIYEVAARGWLSWASTTNGQKLLDERNLITYGVTSVLTDDVELTMDYIYELKAQDINVKVNELFTVNGLVTGKDGSYIEECSITLLSEGHVVETANGYKFEKAGVYTVLPCYKVVLSRLTSSNIIYYIYGAPIKVSVTN